MRTLTSGSRRLHLLVVAGILVGCEGKRETIDTSAAFVETEATINPNEAQRTTRHLAVLRDAARQYEVEFKKPPAQLRDLERLDGKWLSYEKYEKWSRDGWGREYRLVVAGATVEISSAGPDGEFGTNDDIR